MAKLYVVATPIGNLNDISPRMAETLSACDLIAAEDTRVTMKLTQTLGIHKPMVSCHRHNETDRAPGLIERMLTEDLTVALTCDAGTPGISDPGQALVSAAWAAGIPVVPVSGPSAAITALSAAGFEARRFAFYGFLPRENKALREQLSAILETGIPVAVVYESPHRVVDLTEKMAQCWPGAKVCVCCDLTKKFELIVRGEVLSVLQTLRANPNVEKGEYCLVVDLSDVPAPVRAESGATAAHAILDALLAGADMAQAARAAAELGFKRNDIYRARLAISELFAREAAEGNEDDVKS